MNSAIVFLLIFSFFAFVIQSDALRCYECKGKRHHNKDCFTPIDNSRIQKNDCRYSEFILGNHPGMVYECAAVLTHDERNITVVERGCSVKKDIAFCTWYRRKMERHGVTVDECYTCEEDLCNSGEIKRLAFAVLPLLVVLLLFNEFEFF